MSTGLSGGTGGFLGAYACEKAVKLSLCALRSANAASSVSFDGDQVRGVTFFMARRGSRGLLRTLWELAPMSSSSSSMLPRAAQNKPAEAHQQEGQSPWVRLD